MSAPSRGEELRCIIATEEATLARLERECAETRSRLATARAEIESAAVELVVPARHTSVPVPRTNDEKVALFRQLFQGREDVFPTRFESKKGKSGYSPACKNKFAPGLCDLPKVKCGDCKNQAFTPVSDDAILDHLKGQHVMGVYPLLADETCWFLAVDFDKSQWMDDVRAFLETCQQVDVPAVVERSRSGNGAHVYWRLGVTSVRALTTLVSTRCFWLYRCPGRGLSCSTPDGFIGSIRARPTCVSTTTSTATYRCSTGCSTSVCAATCDRLHANRRAGEPM